MKGATTKKRTFIYKQRLIHGLAWLFAALTTYMGMIDLGWHESRLGTEAIA